MDSLQKLRFGEFLTKCSHRIVIARVKKTGGIQEGKTRCVIRGPRVKNKNGEKVLYFSTWEDLEPMLNKYFGEIPTIEIWLTNEKGAVNDLGKQINEIEEATQADYHRALAEIRDEVERYEAGKSLGEIREKALGNFYQINDCEKSLVDLSHDILEEGGEYNAQDLVEKILSRFYSELMIYSESDIRNKIMKITSQGLNKINFLETEETKEELGNITITKNSEVRYTLSINWRNLREEIEGYNGILYRGEKRGRFYRHKSTRPRFPEKYIAWLFCRTLEEHGEPVSKMSLYNASKQPLIDHHYNLEKGLEARNDKMIRLGINSIYTKEYGRKFEEWAEEAYNTEWWLGAWSNINKEMKKLGARQGHKRGTWIMGRKPVSKKGTHLGTSAALVKKINKLENEILEMGRESIQKEDTIDLAIFMLNGVIKTLRQRKGNLERSDLTFGSLEETELLDDNHIEIL